jgi:hypothetical protein
VRACGIPAVLVLQSTVHAVRHSGYAAAAVRLLHLTCSTRPGRQEPPLLHATRRPCHYILR